MNYSCSNTASIHPDLKARLQKPPTCLKFLFKIFSSCVYPSYTYEKAYSSKVSNI